jgi:putative tricarboxylic transport membrane protein
LRAQGAVAHKRRGEGDDKNKKILESARGVGQEEPLALQRARREHSLFAHVFHFRRDFCAGGLMILFGLIAAVNGPNYHVGTLMHMGPGFMPTVLGILLIILGITIAGTASVGATEGGETDTGNLLPPHPQWFAWLCILSGPALFVVFGSVGGMAPATFACVFVAALGDRESTWKSSLILAAGVTFFGVLLFHYVLQIPMPVLEWKSPIQAWGL